MRRSLLVLLLFTGCKSPERRFLDGRDRENARESELIDLPRKKRDAVMDVSAWPPSNAGGYNYAPR